MQGGGRPSAAGQRSHRGPSVNRRLANVPIDYRLTALIAVVIAPGTHVVDLWCDRWTPSADHLSTFTPHHRFERFPASQEEPFNHGLLVSRPRRM